MEGFDAPNDFILSLNELVNWANSSFIPSERHSWSCTWDWEFDLNVLCEMISWKSWSNFHCYLKLERTDLLNIWVNSKWCLKFSCNPIIHDKKFSIWWSNSQSLHALKIACIYTFMKRAIIYHSWPSISSSFASNLKIFIKD